MLRLAFECLDMLRLAFEYLDMSNKSFKKTPNNFVFFRNNLKLLDKQLKVNFHGDREGKPGNGKHSGGFDVTIPNGRVYSGKFKEALQIIPSAS